MATRIRRRLLINLCYTLLLSLVAPTAEAVSHTHSTNSNHCKLIVGLAVLGHELLSCDVVTINEGRLYAERRRIYLPTVRVNHTHPPTHHPSTYLLSSLTYLSSPPPTWHPPYPSPPPPTDLSSPPTYPSSPPTYSSSPLPTRHLPHLPVIFPTYLSPSPAYPSSPPTYPSSPSTFPSTPRTYPSSPLIYPASPPTSLPLTSLVSHWLAQHSEPGLLGQGRTGGRGSWHGVPEETEQCAPQTASRHRW